MSGIARGVRAWHEGWWEIGRETGNLLAPILGVRARHDHHAPERDGRAVDRRVVRVVRRAAPQDRPAGSRLPDQSLSLRRTSADTAPRSIYVPSDRRVRAPIDRLVDAIDDRTALVPISLVLFRSGCLQDVRPVVEKAHRVGARVDSRHLPGAPAPCRSNLAALGVDFAVGGSVKWLCGGPGAGYLYVRPDLDRPAAPVRRRLGRARDAVRRSRPAPIRYADGIERFQSGTPNVPSLVSARARLRDRRRDRRAGDSRAIAASSRAG